MQCRYSAGANNSSQQGKPSKHPTTHKQLSPPTLAVYKDVREWGGRALCPQHKLGAHPVRRKFCQNTITHCVAANLRENGRGKAQPRRRGQRVATVAAALLSAVWRQEV